MTRRPERGCLLVAAPMLTDPNFDRTVVLMLEYSPDGAVGIVLNRPSGAEIPWPLDSWRDVAADPTVVFIGGPVQPEVGLGLARHTLDAPHDAASGAADSELLPGIRTLDLNIDDPSVLSRSDLSVRLFAGYAGWGPGQLDGELDEGAWFVVDAEDDDAFTADPADLWWRVLGRQDNELRRLAFYPPDLAMN
ncbi:MAG: YqgE/AlgH family protein [Acidimicrobiia bacterium]